MKTKHTPAPWKKRFYSGKDDGESMFFIEAPNNNKPELGYGIEILMEDFGEHNGYPREQRLADATLISCAPEMLKVLQETYLQIQIVVNEESRKGNHLPAIHTDSIRAVLRNIISEALNEDSQIVQETIESLAIEKKLN